MSLNIVMVTKLVQGLATQSLLLSNCPFLLSDKFDHILAVSGRCRRTDGRTKGMDALRLTEWGRLPKRRLSVVSRRRITECWDFKFWVSLVPAVM